MSPHLESRRQFLCRMSIAAALAVAGAGPGVAATPDLRVRRLAWAGLHLGLDQTELFIDPLVNAEVWGPALPDTLIPISPLSTGSRYALVTHRHPDHFDPIALRQALGDNGLLVCTPDTADAATSLGIRARAAVPYEPLLLGDFTVTAVPAADGYGDAQISWVVQAAGRRIIHCGDTLWHGAWWHIGRQLGPFDAAFLPINGARFKWRQPVSDIPAVLTPEQAVAAAVVLGAKRLVPIHFGMKASEGYEEVTTPVADLLAAAEKRNMRVTVLRPGDWLSW